MLTPPRDSAPKAHLKGKAHLNICGQLSQISQLCKGQEAALKTWVAKPYKGAAIEAKILMQLHGPQTHAHEQPAKHAHECTYKRGSNIGIITNRLIIRGREHLTK